ncbi:MAG: hypothetical protein JRF63_11285 [Deltaproteobacteria bacterium]|nr:hypothetical protein [Deltaproteobacteria bacterium]
MRNALGIIFICGLLLVASLPVAAQEPANEPQLPERFVGHMANLGGPGAGPGAAFFTLHIDQYSTEQEILELLALLKKDGQDAVIEALWDMEEKGWIKVGNSLGYHVAIIRSFESEGGRVIRVLTDRPIQFVESMRGLRSKDYPFGIIEVRIGPDGTGNGVLIAAAKAKFTDKGQVEIESFGTQPIKILNLKQKKIKKKK